MPIAAFVAPTTIAATNPTATQATSNHAVVLMHREDLVFDGQTGEGEGESEGGGQKRPLADSQSKSLFHALQALSSASTARFQLVQRAFLQLADARLALDAVFIGRNAAWGGVRLLPWTAESGLRLPLDPSLVVFPQEAPHLLKAGLHTDLLEEREDELHARYQAPERIRGDEDSAEGSITTATNTSTSSDGTTQHAGPSAAAVWAFGVALWEALHPNLALAYSTNSTHGPEPVHALLLRIAKQEALLDCSEAVLQGAPITLLQLLRDCLHTSPSQRPTMHQVQQRLAALAVVQLI
jgi:hypothetical protein